jgi:phosphoglycerate dehydrogenase-like enzyme
MAGICPRRLPGDDPGSVQRVSTEAAVPRAAVAPAVLAIIAERSGGGVEIVPIDASLDYETVDFLIPPAGDRSVLDVLNTLTRLQVVQVMSAGTDWIEDEVPPQATLCNARGARDGPVAEWILGALLGASTGLLAHSGATSWDRSHTLQDLGGWTVLVVGMGSIGRRLAAYVEPLGTRVIGVASRAHDGLHGPDELAALLPAADAVVLLAPLTDATRGLFDADALARMRDGALLVNAARGAVVVTDALAAELATGRLRAVLDVVDPEPLPDGHPLWRVPGLLSMTPHIGGDSPAGNRRAAELAGDQLARWNRGEQLVNVVRRGSR